MPRMSDANLQQVWDDVKQYVANHSGGGPGAETDPVWTAEKANYVTKNTTINSKALTSSVVLRQSDINSASFNTYDATTMANVFSMTQLDGIAFFEGVTDRPELGPIFVLTQFDNITVCKKEMISETTKRLYSSTNNSTWEELGPSPLDSMKEDIFNWLMPVGTIYGNGSETTNPATLFGFGVWAAYGGTRTVVGVGAGYALGSSGGATTSAHTHTSARHGHSATQDTHNHVIPMHYHTAPGHQHTIPSHTHDSASHSHGDGTLAAAFSTVSTTSSLILRYEDRTGSWRSTEKNTATVTAIGGSDSVTESKGIRVFGSTADVTPADTGAWSGNSGTAGGTATSTVSGVSTASVTPVITVADTTPGATGSTASSTIQPYVVAQLWIRTA